AAGAGDPRRAERPDRGPVAALAAGTGRRRRTGPRREPAGRGLTAGRPGDRRLPGRPAGAGRRPAGRGGPAVAGSGRRRPAGAVPVPDLPARPLAMTAARLAAGDVDPDAGISGAAGGSEV